MSGEWRSIKSAPRDGTSILIVIDGGVTLGWWWQVDPEMWKDMGRDTESGWHCCNKWDEPKKCKPTQWQPLPSLPPTKERQGKSRRMLRRPMIRTNVAAMFAVFAVAVSLAGHAVSEGNGVCPLAFLADIVDGELQS